jgi:hypothetical protein
MINIPDQYQSKEKFEEFISYSYKDNLILWDMLEYFDQLTPLERKKETQCATLSWNKSLISKTRDDRNLALWETKQLSDSGKLTKATSAASIVINKPLYYIIPFIIAL